MIYGVLGCLNAAMKDTPLLGSQHFTSDFHVHRTDSKTRVRLTGGGVEQFIIFPNPDQNFRALSNTLEKQWMKTAMKLECFYRKNFVILSEN